MGKDFQKIKFSYSTNGFISVENIDNEMEEVFINYKRNDIESESTLSDDLVFTDTTVYVDDDRLGDADIYQLKMEIEEILIKYTKSYIFK